MTRYPVPAVAAVLVDAGGRVWLRATEGGYRLPVRPLPGGEDWEASLRRLLEECGAGPEKNGRLVGIYSEADGPVAHDREGCASVVAAFRVAADEAAGDRGGWFAAGALPAELPPGQRAVVADALAFRGRVVTR